MYHYILRVLTTDAYQEAIDGTKVHIRKSGRVIVKRRERVASEAALLTLALRALRESDTVVITVAKKPGLLRLPTKIHAEINIDPIVANAMDRSCVACTISAMKGPGGPCSSHSQIRSA